MVDFDEYERFIVRRDERFEAIKSPAAAARWITQYGEEEIRYKNRLSLAFGGNLVAFKLTGHTEKELYAIKRAKKDPKYREQISEKLQEDLYAAL